MRRGSRQGVAGGADGGVCRADRCGKTYFGNARLCSTAWSRPRSPSASLLGKKEEKEEEGKEDEVVAKIQDQIVETFKFTQEPVQQHNVLASTCQCRSS